MYPSIWPTGFREKTWEGPVAPPGCPALGMVVNREQTSHAALISYLNRSPEPALVLVFLDMLIPNMPLLDIAC
jgi:hypothetical protein